MEDVVQIQVAADLADFVEAELEKGRHVQMKQWIDANPDNLGIVLLATFNATIEDIFTAPVRLGESAAIDMLRLGTGTAEGTKLGIAEDILRLVSLIPQGRVAKAAGSLRPWLGGIVQGIANSRYWRAIKGQNCVDVLPVNWTIQNWSFPHMIPASFSI